jgi:hypothetical protein
MQCVDLVAQARGQNLLELAKRPQRGFLAAREAAAGRHPQAHSDGDRLVVVEQEWRQRGARAKP